MNANETQMKRTLAALPPFDINWATLCFNGTLINAEFRREVRDTHIVQMNSLMSVLLQEMTNKSVTVGPFK